MLAVQKFLANVVSDTSSAVAALEALKAQTAIKYKVYEEDYIVILNYDQIDSPKSDPRVIECRSLILSFPNFGVVSRKFDRFFNHGECPEFYTDFDFSRAIVQEKVDGSLIGIYYNPMISRHEISTRGMAKSEGEHLYYNTFRDCVLDTIGVNESKFQSVANHIMNKQFTYVFECIGPKNRIVKKYDRAELVLLAVIDNETGRTMDSDFCEKTIYEFQQYNLNIRLPAVYEASDADSILSMVSEFKDLDEGVVAFDPVANKRIKIKSKTYVVAHQLRGNDPVPTRKNLLTVIFEGEVDELLAYFPEFKEYVDPLVEEYMSFVEEMNHIWWRSLDITDQKEFALKVKDFRCSGVLFEARKRNVRPVNVFLDMPLNKKLRLFGA